MSRWPHFFIVLLLGLGLGLLYGWVINPVSYQDTTLDTLRIDYKTDYTLMVAEVYHQSNDIDWAMNRLTLLKNKSPLHTIEESLKFAAQAEYTLPDMFLLRDLHNALKENNYSNGSKSRELVYINGFDPRFNLGNSLLLGNISCLPGGYPSKLAENRL